MTPIQATARPALFSQDVNHMLLIAAKTGNASDIEWAAKGNFCSPDPNTVRYALLSAARNGHQSVLICILRHFLSFEMREPAFNQALAEAARKGHSRVVKHLLEEFLFETFDPAMIIPLIVEIYCREPSSDIPGLLSDYGSSNGLFSRGYDFFKAVITQGFSMNLCPMLQQTQSGEGYAVPREFVEAGIQMALHSNELPAAYLMLQSRQEIRLNLARQVYTAFANADFAIDVEEQMEIRRKNLIQNGILSD